VAIYEYRCDTHGLFEISRPLGTAPESAACEACGSPSRRVFSAPAIRSGARSSLWAAIDHSEKSAHEPEVVSSVPSAGASGRPRVVPLTPKLAGLPRP